MIAAGTQTIGGTGTIRFDGADAINNVVYPTSGTLTIGPNVTIQTGAAGGAVGGSFESAGGTVVNQGTIWSRTAGQTLWMLGDWDNDGTLKLTDGTLALGGTFTPADIGTIDRAGGRVIIVGQVDNAGSVFQTTAATGAMDMVIVGGLPVPKITDGIVRGNAVAPLTIDGGRLENVTIEGRGGILFQQLEVRGLSIAPGAALEVPGTLWLGYGTPFGAAETLGGGGEVVLNGGTIRDYNSHVTLASDLTVRGSGAIHTGNGFTQNALITTRGGGGIAINTTVFNNFYIPWSNAGMLQATDGGTLTLGGDIPVGGLGNFESTNGGQIRVVGKLQNAGNTITLNADHAFSFGGQLFGGTIRSADATRLHITTGGATNPVLRGVLADIDVNVPSFIDLALLDGTTMAAGRKIHMIGEQNTVRFGPTFAGEILLESNTSFGSRVGTTTNQTFGSGVTIRTAGGNGSIGGEGPTFTTDSHALLSAETEGNTLAVYGSGNTFNNYGTMRVSAGTFTSGARLVNRNLIDVVGGTFNLDGGWDSAPGTIRVSGGQLNLAGTFDTSRFGTFERTGGGVALTGTFNNTTGTTADLTDIVGPWAAAGSAVINGGSVVAPAPGQPLRVTGGSLTVNNAALDTDIALAPGAALALNGAWDNNGAISGDAAAVTLAGTFDTDDIGGIDVTDSTVDYVGNVNNVGRTLPVAFGVGTNVTLRSGGKVTGGTIGHRGQSFTITNASLDGVSLAADANVSVATAVTVTNGLTLVDGATVSLANGPAVTNPWPNPTPTASPALNFSGGAQTLGGTGHVVFAGGNAGAAAVQPTSGGTLTIDSNVTIRTGAGSGSVGADLRTTINRGTIAAASAGQTIKLAGTFNNHGTIEARNGGTILPGPGVRPRQLQRRHPYRRRVGSVRRLVAGAGHRRRHGQRRRRHARRHRLDVRADQRDRRQPRRVRRLGRPGFHDEGGSGQHRPPHGRRRLRPHRRRRPDVRR